MLPPNVVAQRSKGDELVLGFCGRLDMHTKGLDLMLEGFAHFLKQTKVNARLWIIGDGADNKAVQARVAELKLGASVVMWGARYGDEKNGLLSELDAFLCPSRNEGMPTAVLEAAGLGVPAIVSPESNIADAIVQHGAGIGMKENTAAQLAAAMQSLWASKREGGLQQMRENARHMVDVAFSWNNIAEQLITVYKG